MISTSQTKQSYTYVCVIQIITILDSLLLPRLTNSNLFSHFQNSVQFVLGENDVFDILTDAIFPSIFPISPGHSSIPTLFQSRRQVGIWEFLFQRETQEANSWHLHLKSQGSHLDKRLTWEKNMLFPNPTSLHRVCRQPK